MRAAFRRSLRLSASSRYPGRGARGVCRLKSIYQNGTPPRTMPGRRRKASVVHFSSATADLFSRTPWEWHRTILRSEHARRGECRTEDDERDQATAPILRKVLARFKDVWRSGVWSWGRQGRLQLELVGLQARGPQISCACASDVWGGLGIKTELLHVVISGRRPLMRRREYGPSPWWWLFRCWI